MAMSNAVGWFDIHVSEMKRAVDFYERVFLRKLVSIGDPTSETRMMGFPGDMGAYGAGGALVESTHGRPGMGGTMVYFSVEDCAEEASRVVAAGGKVLRPRFSIGEFGWVSICEDTEGNGFGISSMR